MRRRYQNGLDLIAPESEASTGGRRVRKSGRLSDLGYVSGVSGKGMVEREARAAERLITWQGGVVKLADREPWTPNSGEPCCGVRRR
jgi:hypothetical protein